MYDRMLRDFPWVVNSDVPWKHLGKDVSECKVALLTTAGLYQHKLQKHFNLADETGDSSFREIKKGVLQDELRVSHRFIDLRESAGVDFNCIFPMDRLTEMEKEKRISAVSEVHFSLMGEIRDPKSVIEDSVSKIIKQLQKFLVDVVILSPVGPLGHQVAALAARTIEDAEISTVMISALKSVCQNARPPRTVLVRFPFGQLFGAPFDRETQREILNECLIHVKSIREPGEIAELGNRWKDSFSRALANKPDLLQVMSDSAKSSDTAEKRKIAANKF